MSTDYGHRAALEYAVRSKEQHGIQLNGRCGYCRTIWPCEPFWVAHHAVLRLSVATANTAADMKALEWRLFARGSGEPVNVGDTVTSRHGNTGKVTAVEPPVWPDFVGKVRVDSGDIAYFVEVFDLEFRQI